MIFYGKNKLVNEAEISNPISVLAITAPLFIDQFCYDFI